MKTINCIKTRMIYDEVDANETTSKDCCIKAKQKNNSDYIKVAIFSLKDGTVKFLNKAAKYDFLVNEMIYSLNKIYGY